MLELVRNIWFWFVFRYERRLERRSRLKMERDEKRHLTEDSKAAWERSRLLRSRNKQAAEFKKNLDSECESVSRGEVVNHLFEVQRRSSIVQQEESKERAAREARQAKEALLARKRVLYTSSQPIKVMPRPVEPKAKPKRVIKPPKPYLE